MIFVRNIVTTALCSNQEVGAIVKPEREKFIKKSESVISKKHQGNLYREENYHRKVQEKC